MSWSSIGRPCRVRARVVVDDRQVVRLGEVEARVGRLADDEDPAVDAEHVDVRAVQVGEPLRGEDLVGRPGRPAAVDDEEDPVDEVEDRVDVVGHEEDRPAGPPLPAADEPGDLLLVADVEARQRLVAEKEARVADEGLGDAETLLLAARQAADGRLGECRRLDPLDRLRDRALDGRRRATDPPAVPVDAEPDEVAAAQGQVAVERLVLGHVADARVAPSRRPPEDLDRAGGQPAEPEDDLEERRLARPVGTEDGDERAGSQSSDRSLQTPAPR